MDSGMHRHILKNPRSSLRPPNALDRAVPGDDWMETSRTTDRCGTRIGLKTSKSRRGVGASDGDCRAGAIRIGGGDLYASTADHGQSSTERPNRDAMNHPYGNQHYDGFRGNGGWRGNLSH